MSGKLKKKIEEMQINFYFVYNRIFVKSKVTCAKKRQVDIIDKKGVYERGTDLSLSLFLSGKKLDQKC